MIDVLFGIWRRKSGNRRRKGKKYNSNWLGSKTKLTPSILFITSTCFLLSPCFLYSVTIKIYPLRIWSFRFCDKRKLSFTSFTFLRLSYSFFNFSESFPIPPKQITETIFFTISRFILPFYYISLNFLFLFILIKLNPKLNHQRGQSHVIDSVYRFVLKSENTIVIPTFSQPLFNPTFDPPARLARY